MKKSMFLTDGLKFGSDYLAYEGDPLIYHAKYLVKVRSQSSLGVLDLIADQRMANANKKTLLIAYLNKDDLI